MDAEQIYSFGIWVKRRRRALRLSQHELAQLVACSVALIRKIEADERRPSPGVAALLAHHLSLPPEQHGLFVRAARAEVAPFNLPAPHHPIRMRPPRSADAGNIPSTLVQLIGREAELARIQPLLAASRLVTLSGPPGVGKTSLALECARRVARSYGDGAWFVPLAMISDPALVPATIARVLDAEHTDGHAPLDGLARALRSRRLLLLLDNLEQLPDAAHVIAELLAGTTQLTILGTSRAPLHLIGEQVVVVQPLSEPSAQALFSARAEAVAPGTMDDPGGAADVAEIVRRLDCLPLAIELAAARVRLFGLRLLRARIESGVLRELRDGPRNLPARQQTLHAAIAWSYTLLAPAEQALFRSLGVFAGGWSAAAAAAVAQVQADAALDTLAALLDQQLIVRVAAAGPMRFAQLETLRAFALERLAEAGELQGARRRHAQFMTALAARVDVQRAGGPATQQWLDDVDAELDNIRAALAWCAGDGDPELGARLAGALTHFWRFRASHAAEGYGWTEAIIAAGGGIAPRPRADLLRAAAFLAWYWQDIDRAERYGRESLAIYQELGERAIAAEVLLILGRVAFSGGRVALAEERDRAAHTLGAELGDPLLCFRSAHELATVLFTLGDDAQATALLDDCVARRHDVSPAELVWALTKRMRLHIAAGELARAQSLGGEILESCQELGLDYGVVTALRELAHCALLRGERGAARSLARQSVALSELLHDPLQEGITRYCCALVELVLGDAAAARALSERGAEQLVKGHDPWHGAVACVGAGTTALACDDAPGALAHYAEGLRQLRQLAPESRAGRRAIGYALCGAGIALAAQAGRTADAWTCFAAAERLDARLDDAGYPLAAIAMPLIPIAPERHAAAVEAVGAALGASAEADWRAAAARGWQHALALVAG